MEHPASDRNLPATIEGDACTYEVSGSQDENPDLWMTGTQPAHDLDSTGFQYLDIQDRDLGFVCGDHCLFYLPIISLRDHFDIGGCIPTECFT